MNVKRAKTAGFCFGVKRAVETVYEQAKNSDAAPIYTYGPIIHNEEVVKDLENQGVIVLRTEQELEQLTEGTVIIRSHGVAKYIYEKLEKKKIQIVDATCPFVKKIHRIVSRESAAAPLPDPASTLDSRRSYPAPRAAPRPARAGSPGPTPAP